MFETWTVWGTITNVVTICSIASLILPAVEDFDDFPRLQKVYRLFCKVVVKWGSLSLRGKILEVRGVLKNGGNGTAGPPPSGTL